MSSSPDPQALVVDAIQHRDYWFKLPPLEHWVIMSSTDTVVLEALEALGNAILSGLVSDVVKKHYPTRRPAAFYAMVTAVVTANRTSQALIAKYSIGYPKMRMTYKHSGDYFEMLLGASSLENTAEELLPWATATFGPLIDALDCGMSEHKFRLIREPLPKRKLESIPTMDTSHKRHKREAQIPPFIATALPLDQMPSTPTDDSFQGTHASSSALPLLSRISPRAHVSTSPVILQSSSPTRLAQCSVDAEALLSSIACLSTSASDSAPISGPVETPSTTPLNIKGAGSNSRPPIKIRRPQPTSAFVAGENTGPLRNDIHGAKDVQTPHNTNTNTKTLMDVSRRSNLPEAPRKMLFVNARPSSMQGAAAAAYGIRRL